MPLYEKLSALKQNWRAILAGVLCGVVTALVSIWAMCRLFGLGRALFMTLLPKSITAAIAKPLSESYGGIVPLTLIAIMLTGVLGNSLGPEILDLFRVREPVAHGQPVPGGGGRYHRSPVAPVCKIDVKHTNFI